MGAGVGAGVMSIEPELDAALLRILHPLVQPAGEEQDNVPAGVVARINSILSETVRPNRAQRRAAVRQKGTV